MPTLITVHRVDAAGRDELLRPREDIVAERAAGTGRYVLAEGAFVAYERNVAVADEPEGAFRVEERIDYRLGLPYAGWLFALPARHALRTWRRRDGTQPFWAPPQRLDHRSAVVLCVLCAAALFAGFLTTLVSQTITFAAEEFGASDTAQGAALAVIRVGVLLALVVVAAADRRGRRIAVAVAIGAGVAATAAGAAAPSLAWLAATQTVGRAFGTSLLILIGVMLAEEMPRGTRAYAVALAAMSTSLGSGVVALSLPLADLGERAWRILYLIPLLALPLAVDVVRRLPESKRFRRRTGWSPPRGYGRRLALVATTMFLVNLFVGPASQFRNDYLNDELGWSATTISIFIITTSTPAGLFVLAGGRAADVVGRKLIAAVGLATGTLAAACVFLSDGAAVWTFGLLANVLGGAAAPALLVFGPELFPTRIRGSANGITATVQVAGSAAGLLIAGWWSDASGGFGQPMSVLVAGPLLAAALVWWRYPETRGRELEELEIVPRPVPPDGPGRSGAPAVHRPDGSAPGGATGDTVMRS